jgi:hypothetical protein
MHSTWNAESFASFSGISEILTNDGLPINLAYNFELLVLHNFDFIFNNILLHQL